MGDETLLLPEQWTSWADTLEEICQALARRNLAKLPMAVGCALVFFLVLTFFKLVEVLLRCILRILR